MANKRIGQAGLALIKQYEGCRLAAYRCAAGVWTIGYGHTAGVHSGMTITQAQADAYLQQDIVKFEGYVNNPAYVPITTNLNQNQFDALVSFAFNLGAGISGSFARQNSGADRAGNAKLQQSGWKGAGRLTRRRKAEQALFNKAVSCTGTTAATTTSTNTEDYNMKTIKKGSKGNAVKVWQIIIGAAVDGNFGSGTESATKTGRAITAGGGWNCR